MSNDGLSTVAVQVEEYDNTRKKWTRKKKRPRKYRKKTYGLVVHTTGSGVTSKAIKKKKDVLSLCLDRYLKTGGATYLNGWVGHLIQMANDFELAYGASVKEQLHQHPWDANVSAITSNTWEDRWEHLEGVDSPLDLFPTNYANSCYVHVEMPPVFGYDQRDKLVQLAEAMRPGLWFTKAQHDNVVLLAIDLADRNNWPDKWWRTGRLVGHEDVSPHTRHIESGGWDPGALRTKPRFDWDYVYAGIEAEYAKRDSAKKSLEEAEEAAKNAPSPDPSQPIIDWLVSWVYGLFGRRK